MKTFFPMLLIVLTGLFLSACGRTGAAQEIQTATLKVEGMTCESCVNGIGSMLSQLPGVTEYAVNLEAGSAQVSYESPKLTAEQVAQRISRLGFKSSVLPAAAAE